MAPPSRRPGPERPLPDRAKTAPGAATLAARAARDARQAKAAKQVDNAKQARHDRQQAGPAFPAAPSAAQPASAARPGEVPGEIPCGVPRQAPAARVAPRRWALPAAIAAGVVGAVALAAAVLLPRQPAAADTAAPAIPLLSMAELLAGHSTEWRLARLKENPAVLVIEFPNLAQQGAAMNRIAALLEKAGAPRDRVLGDAELAALIARGGDNSQTVYQGHDYDGAGLARFYQLAQRQGLTLHADEERVRRELLSAGVLVAAAAGDAHADAGAKASPDTRNVQPQGVQALITFTATQPDDPATPQVDEAVDERRRDSILRHEASHGRFYTRPVYRDHCRRFWRDEWTAQQREKMRVFLAGIGYDRQDEELMLNEAQAFLMNTPDERAINAAALRMTDAELAVLRSRFWQTLPADEAKDGNPAQPPGAGAPTAPAVPSPVSANPASVTPVSPTRP